MNNSHIYHQITHDVKKMGIDVEGVKLNLPEMLKAKDASVKALTGGIETYLFKKYGVDYIKGAGSFASPNTLNIALNDGGETQIEAKNIIIATGSEVSPFPGIEIDEERIVSSTGALDLKEVPKKVSPKPDMPAITPKIWADCSPSYRWSSLEVVSSVWSSDPFGPDSVLRLPSSST